MGTIFHNYKQLMQITKDEDITIAEDPLKEESVSLLVNKPEGKVLFYRYSKKWYGFIYALHKEDRLILLKMILEVCSYNECNINIINIQDGSVNLMNLFKYFSILIYKTVN
jgi:hypothetical protein